jgi:hypothetical protein
MTWNYSGNVIESSKNNPKAASKGSAGRSVNKHRINGDFVQGIRHIAMDALKLIHSIFSFLRVTAAISTSAAVCEITSKVISHYDNPFSACPNCICITLVFDGPPSPLKSDEI